MKTAAAAVLVGLSLSVGASAQSQPGGPAAPPPAPGAPAQNPSAPTLKADEKVVRAFLTSLAALKHCGFGGRDRTAALGRTYGLRPDAVDPELARRIRQETDGAAAKDKGEFCNRVWQRYGEHGVDMAGLLTLPGTAKVAGWNIEPFPATGALQYCQGYRTPERGTTELITRGKQGTTFAVIAAKLKLNVRRNDPVVIEAGSARKTLTDDQVSVTPDQLLLDIPEELVPQLRRADGFTVRSKDQAMTVSLKGGGEIIDALDACVKANAAR